MNLLCLIILVAVSSSNCATIPRKQRSADGDSIEDENLLAELEPDNDVEESESGNMLRADTVTAWPNAEIYYEVIQTDFTKTQKQLIAQAICLIEKASCVRFLPKNATTDFYVSVQKADKCSTLIGRQPTAGAQIVHLNPKVCFDRVGQIAHEFFHALGFYHEVQRNDRDNYVVLNYQNLIKQSSARQFNIKNPIAGNYEGPFDFESVMLYNRQEFAKKGTTSFDPRPNATVPHGVHIGQRSKLSDVDIQKLNSFYDCTYVTPKATTCA